MKTKLIEELIEKIIALLEEILSIIRTPDGD